MSSRKPLALLLLLGVLSCAILGLISRQRDLVARVHELERELSNARRVRAADPVSAVSPSMVRETASPSAPAEATLPDDPKQLKKTIQELRESLAKALTARDAGRSWGYSFPADVIWPGGDDLGLTDPQRSKISEIEKRRDAELAAFDAAGLPLDDNRAAFRKEIENRHRLLILQELDPIQQAKFDALPQGQDALSVEREAARAVKFLVGSNGPNSVRKLTFRVESARWSTWDQSTYPW